MNGSTDGGDGKKSWANPTVLGAGITSALGDFAYETTSVLLPGFLAVLGLPAAALGAIEGIADAVMSFTKLAAGHIGNRLGRRKLLVVIGYGLTPIGQILIALAWGWPLILAGRVVSWFGKGLRGPLRDAIIAESIAPETKGRSFGFHRTMDTIGAIVGPTLGVLLLAITQNWNLGHSSNAFRVVFWLTLIPGGLSVLSFVVFVRDDGGLPNKTIRMWQSLQDLPLEFRKYLAAVCVYGMGDFSHSMLILLATQLLTPEMGVSQAAQFAGGLYVLRNVIQTATSYPIGLAADRWGHRPVLLCGYLIGVLTAALAASLPLVPAPYCTTLLGVLFCAAGLYISVQETIESTVTTEFVAATARSTAFGALGAVNGFAKLFASTIVGVLWTLFSPSWSFAAAAVLLASGTGLMTFVLVRRESRT